MSLIPMLFRLHRALYMDHMKLTSDALRAVVSLPRFRIQQPDPELGATTINKNGFQTCMDVQQFQPNEITVKTVDNTVVVEGKHEEREDNHGIVSRHFIRKFTLPSGFDVKNVVSTLSSDGILTIKAAAPKEAIESSERIVNIQQTGPARLKENPAVESKKEEPEK